MFNYDENNRVKLDISYTMIYVVNSCEAKLKLLVVILKELLPYYVNELYLLSKLIYTFQAHSTKEYLSSSLLGV